VTALTKLFRTTTFRLSLTYLALFSAAAIVAIFYIYWNTTVLLSRQLNQTIDAELKGLAEQYRAGGLDQLDQDAVTAPRMEEGDGTLGAFTRGRIDQLDPVDLEPQERLREVGDLEADVVDALATLGQEPRSARRVVGGLDQLDLRLADRQERDPDAVLGHVLDDLELETERIPPEAQGRLQLLHDHGNVMDPPETADPCRHAVGLRGGRHSAERTLSPPDE